MRRPKEKDRDLTTEPVTDGYRAPLVCRLVGITYRQLDYWARTNLIKPSLQDAKGSGSQRLYSFPDVIQLKVIRKLLDAGMSLKKIRQAVLILREQMQSRSPLADVTLLSDGATIYAAHSAPRSGRCIQGRPGCVRHRHRTGAG